MSEPEESFEVIVAQEWSRLWSELWPTIRHGLVAKYPNFAVLTRDEPDPKVHPEAYDEEGRIIVDVFGDFQYAHNGTAMIVCYHNPIVRHAPETGIATREHVRRILLHELAHACGLSHDRLAPYGI
jgi:hypothetical protein